MEEVKKQGSKTENSHRVSAAWSGAFWEMRDYSAVERNPQLHHVSISGAGSGTPLVSPKVANGRQESLF